jgi:hypothetical protein
MIFIIKELLVFLMNAEVNMSFFIQLKTHSSQTICWQLFSIECFEIIERVLNMSRNSDNFKVFY